MFNWSNFTEAAKDSMHEAAIDDADLQRILASPDPPPSDMDEFGRALANCARVSLHPDIANYKRALNVRRSLAVDEGNEGYVQYADRLLNFLDLVTSLDELYLVQIVTPSGRYEFCFCPQRRSGLASDVTKLAGESDSIG